MKKLLLDEVRNSIGERKWRARGSITVQGPLASWALQTAEVTAWGGY